MRLLRSLLWCVTLGGLGIIALLFLVQNLHTERIVFFGLTATLNFALVVAGAVAIGFLLALLLIVPGRIATALYARSLDRELRQLERQVAQLGEQRERLMDGREQLLLRYERLFAHHDKVIAERDRLRAQLASASATATPNRAAAEERVPATAVPARQPLELRERERAVGNEVRAAPVRVAPVAVDERRPVSAPATASAHTSADARARVSARAIETAPETALPKASVPGGRILPPMLVAADPPAAHLPPVAPDPPVAAVPAVVPDPPAATSTPDRPAMPLPIAAASQATAAGTASDAATPPAEVRSSQMRERVARHTAAAREQLGQWRGQAGQVRRSAGARYNEMRTTLLARARTIAGSVRQFPTPSAAAQRDTAQPNAAQSETRASSASTAAARDEDGRESSSMLKGELPVWRPPE